MLFSTSLYYVILIRVSFRIDEMLFASNVSCNMDNKVSNDTKTSSSYTEPMKAEKLHESTRESIGKKYTAIRGEEIEEERNWSSKEKNILDDTENPQDTKVEPTSSKLASTWESVKIGFRNFKSNMEAKNFIPIRQAQDTKPSSKDSSESLDEIFERIKRPTSDHRNYGSDGDDDHLNDYAMGIRKAWTSR